jgi:hypothetical protein
MTPDDAAADPRWSRLHGEGLACSCGERHVGLIALSFLRPPGWQGPPAPQPNAALRMDGDILTDDFCVIEGRYFAMRMSMPLPVMGAPPPAILLSVWAAVSRASFEALQTPRFAMPTALDPQDPARLLTRIAGYSDTGGLMGRAFSQPDGPPLLVLEKSQAGSFGVHPLVSEHRDGIRLDRMFEVYAANGHDMRSSSRTGAS